MEENKGILKKIQELLNKVFGINKNKQLPQPNTIEIDSENENNNDFKKKIAVSNEKNIDSEELENNVLIEELEPQIDEVERFSFPANLRGYTFKTDVILDENSPKGSYVCSLVNYDEKRTENSLPICRTLNSKKARIVEDTLLGIKGIIDEDYSKDLISTINEKGFRLESNEDERFKVTEDYHLSDVLQKILDAKQKNENIEIPINYLYKSTPKGYKIIKSARLIEIEKEKERRRNIDFDGIIKRHIIDDEPINFDDMNEEQIDILKQHYYKMISEISNQNNIEKYFDFAVSYISKKQIKLEHLEHYKEIKKELKKYVGNSFKTTTLLRNLDTVKRVIVNDLLKELERKSKIFETIEKER